MSWHHFQWINRLIRLFQVEKVLTGYPAHYGGLQPHDFLVSVQGNGLYNFFGAMTLGITTVSIMTININDSHKNDTQYYDTQQNDIDHNES